ncbi:unnamed protein product [Rodentolepis nana]|uniref:Uncharacterized protein n=1 Tax=Rodentolepis nana TaxID=102285 RepID=A0A0R3TF67_RODNA|nr:unnamed protein product [Rodentolepis nana]
MDNSSPEWFKRIASSLTSSESPCYLKELKFTKAFEEPISNKWPTNDIDWTGFTDSFSPFLPRNTGIGCRSFSDSVSIRKPGNGSQFKVPKYAYPPSFSLISSCQAITLFDQEEKGSPSIAESLSEGQTLDIDEEKSCEVFDDQSTVVMNNVIPNWIMRLPSKSESSSWLNGAQFPSGILPLIGKIWLVTEEAQVYWSLATRYDCNLKWNKIGGHFAQVESISLSGEGGGQVTWALGHNGTPWVLRDDWTDGGKKCFTYSRKRFPFNTPHVQTDIRKLRVHEFQSRRIIRGYSSRLVLRLLNYC